MKKFGNLRSKHFETMELSGHDAILVEGESLEWLLKIQDEFNRLQAMGEDEVRYFWIEENLRDGMRCVPPLIRIFILCAS